MAARKRAAKPRATKKPRKSASPGRPDFEAAVRIFNELLPAVQARRPPADLPARLAEMERRLLSCLEAEERHVMARSLLAAVYGQTGRVAEAERELRAAFGHATTADEVANVADVLSDALLSQGRADEARAAVEDALRRAPDAAALVFKRGLLLHKSGDRAAAAASFRRTLELQPGHPLASALLAGSGALPPDDRQARAEQAAREIQAKMEGLAGADLGPEELQRRLFALQQELQAEIHRIYGSP